MFQEILTYELISLIVTTIMGALGIGITALSIRAAQYFGMKRDNEWLAKEQQWRDLLHDTLMRAATKAVSKAGVGSVQDRVNAAMPDILAQTKASIPETLDKLKTSVDSKAVRDIAESYAMDVAKELMRIR